MPEARLQRTRENYTPPVSTCVCAGAVDIPPHVAVQCPVHPSRTVRRGPSCDT